MTEQPNFPGGAQKHELAGGGLLTRGPKGIDAVCVCGWFSKGHFTSLSASAAFREHQDDPASLPSSSSLEERAAQHGIKIGDDLTGDHAPIEADYHELMNMLAHFLDDTFNPPPPEGQERVRKVGFFLTCFEFNKQGRFNYISNAERLDVKTMLLDIAARIEARERAARRDTGGAS